MFQLHAQSGFNKIWYTKEELTSEEEKAIKYLFYVSDVPVKGFNEWLKRTTRVEFENYVRKSGNPELSCCPE